MSSTDAKNVSKRVFAASRASSVITLEYNIIKHRV